MAWRPARRAPARTAEKPSVARDIARVLGASSQGNGYLHGNGYVITWAIGHLAALAQPHEINPDWRQWRRDRGIRREDQAFPDQTLHRFNLAQDDSHDSQETVMLFPKIEK